MNRLNLAPSSAPETYGRDEPTQVCCAACRRGTKALGFFPCARDGACRCHGRIPTRPAQLAEVASDKTHNYDDGTQR